MTANIILKLNLRGTHFDVDKSDIQRFPNSRLGRIAREEHADDRVFINRSARFFDLIVDAHSAGTLHIPNSYGWEAVEREMRFWELDVNILSRSTLARLDEEKEDMRLAEDYKLKYDRFDCALKDSLCPGFSRLCKPVWLFLESPRSSVPAMVYSWVMYVVLPLVSVACIGTLSPFVPPQFKHYSVEIGIDGTEGITMKEDESGESFANARLVIGLVICTAFVVEILVRFVVWPSKIRYLMDPITWSDIVGVLVPIVVIFTSLWSSSVLRSLIVLQLFRIFRLWRSYESCQILSLTLLYSVKYLCLTLVISVVFAFTCAYLCLMFELINNAEAHMISIREALWFSFVTLTTVGYGDVRPLTIGGKAVAVVCAFGGIYTIILPIPILVHHFNKACRIVSIAKCLRRRLLVTKNSNAGSVIANPGEGLTNIGSGETTTLLNARPSGDNNLNKAGNV